MDSIPPKKLEMSFGIVDPIEFTKNYMFLHHLYKNNQT